MAESIDERIVQLTLDNKQFNKASDETINSLEKLKQTLEFKGAIDSFEQVEKEINRVDFAPISKGVDGIGKSFTILDTITDAVFRNMTNRVIAFGERTIKSLSTDQITTGWNKYAEQTGAVQTIMAATANQFDDTATQMGVVNEQLEKLTWFTDETSHKFNDMVSGIGKFTANNIDLDTSVKAMEGIATWASLSGANANEASRAIYNLSQAISVGSVKLIDWKSIQNANMATAEFNKTVIDTAISMGTVTKVGEDMYKVLGDTKNIYSSVSLFSDGLQKAWFTSEVLLKSLDKYGGYADRLHSFVEETGVLTATAMNLVDDYVDGTLDMQEAMKVTGLSIEELNKWMEELGGEQYELGRRALRAAQETKTFAEAIDYVKEAVSSGWATSFKYIFGDYLEAKEWWSEIAEVMYDAFVVGGEIRNTVLEMWKDRGGRDDFLNGIRAIIENVTYLIDIFKSSWNEVWFGIDDEENNQLKNMATLLVRATKAFKDFAEAIKPTEATARNLRDIFTAIFTTLKTGVNIFKSITKGLSPILNLLNLISGTMLQIIGNVARFISMKLEQIFTPERLEKISQALQVIANILSTLIQLGLLAILSVAQKLVSAVKSIYDQIIANGGGIRGVIITLVDTVTDFFNAFMEGETIANKVFNGILYLATAFAAGLKAIVENVVKLITGELTFGDLLSGNGVVSDGINGFGTILDKLNLREKVDKITSWIRDFTSELISADGVISNFIRNFAEGIGILWNSIQSILSVVTVHDIKDFLIIALLWNFVGSLNKVNNSFAGLLTNVGGTFKSFNNIIGTLTDTATPRLTALGNIFNKSKFLQIGIAITLLVAALGKLNELDYNRTAQSAAALGVTMGILLAGFKIYSKIVSSLPKKESNGEMERILNNLGKNLMFTGAAVLMIAQAMKIINDVMASLDGLDTGNYILRVVAMLGGVALIMGALVTAMNSIQKSNSDSGGTKTLVSMLGMAAAIRLLVSSIYLLNNLYDSENPEALIIAIGGVSAVILALGESVNLMSKINWKTALSSIPMIIALSTGLVEITAAIGILASLAPSNALGGALGVMVAEIILLTGSLIALGLSLKNVPTATLAAISSTLLAFGSSLVIISGAMKMLEGYDWEGSKAALGALAGGFILISAGIGILGKVLKGIDIASMGGIAASMLAMSASVAILAGSLRIIEGIQFDQIEAGLKAMGLVFAAFVGLMAIVGVIGAATEGVGMLALAGAMDIIANSFIKFAAAAGILSAAILALSVSAGIIAIIVAALQNIANELGVNLPYMVALGFDTLELIIREFLEMLRNLSDDFFQTVTMLIDVINSAIISRAASTAATFIIVLQAICSEIEEHGQMLIDTFVAIVNMITESNDLLVALGKLAFFIGNYLGIVIVQALCGTLSGLWEGISECVGGWTVKGIEASQDDINNAVQTNMKYAIANLNNSQLNAEAKEATAGLIDSLIDGWIEGKYELDDAMIISAIQAMDKFGDAAGDGARESVDQMLEEWKAGVAENRSEFTDVMEALGESLEPAMGKGADPDKPYDAFSEAVAKMRDMFFEGLEKYGGDFWKAAEYAGLTTANGFIEGLTTGTEGGINNLLANLLVGTNKSMGSGVDESLKSTDPAEYYRQLHEERQKELNKDANDSGYDLGLNFTDGITNGISSGSSKASQQAKTAAQTIAESFSDELDKISRKSEISDKLFKLWTAQNPTASEMEKQAKEIEYQSEKVAIATQKASFTQEIYKQTLEAMGSEAKETHEAYMTMLDDQISLLEAQNKLAEMTKSSATDQKEAWQQYTSLIYQKDQNGEYITEWLKKQGFSTEEIREAYAKQAGYVLPKLAEETSNTMLSIVSENAIAATETMTNNIVESAKAAEPILKEAGASAIKSYDLGAVEEAPRITESLNTVITNSAEAVKPTADTKGQEIGKAEDDGNAKGISDNTETVTKAGEKLCEDVFKTMESYLQVSGDYSQKFWDLGKYIAQGIAKGITDNESAITEAAELAALRAYRAAKEALRIQSPSRVMWGIGKYYDLGFAGGITNYAKTVEKSATDMVNNLVDSTSNSLENQNGIKDYLQRMFGIEDESLHVNVVMDVDSNAYDKKISELEKAYLISKNGDQEDARIITNQSTNPDNLYISPSLQELADSEAYGSRQLQDLYNLVDAYFQEARIAKEYGATDVREPATIENNFVQNNYSPKSISRVDLYRQTERQFNTFANKFGITKSTR